MGLENTWWKTWAAVEGLAVYPSTLQERLINVYVSHLHTLDTAGHEWDLPEDLRADMARIHERMRWSLKVTVLNDAIQVPLDAPSDEDATEIAKLIVKLHFGVNAARDGHGDARFPKR